MNMKDNTLNKQKRPIPEEKNREITKRRSKWRVEIIKRIASLRR